MNIEIWDSAAQARRATGDGENAMALMIPCPNCGQRPFTEFWWAGELPGVPPADDTDVEADFAHVWLRVNAAGEQEERWFHFAGCRRWLTLRRDTKTNTIHAGA